MYEYEKLESEFLALMKNIEEAVTEIVPRLVYSCVHMG